jgi:hypothetical protein
MKITNFLINADRACDYIPVLSTVNNIVDLFQKCVITPFVEMNVIANNRYFQHLTEKSVFRCILLLVPVIGNIVVRSMDSSYKKEVLRQVENDPLSLKNVPSRYQDDRDVVLAAVKKSGKALQYASASLRNDVQVVLTACMQKYNDAIPFASEAIQSRITFCRTTYYQPKGACTPYMIDWDMLTWPLPDYLQDKA